MSNRSTSAVLIALVVAILATMLLACGDDRAPAIEESETPATPAQQTGPPSLDEIANANIHGVYEEPIQLQGGKYEGEPFEPQGASFPRVGLIEESLLTGDLDGDQEAEAVVMLWESSGGSGTFTYLAVMDRDAGDVVNAATAGVGDRVQLRDARISGDRVELDVVQAGPEDAACCPGELATLAWSFDGGTLTPVESAEETARLSVTALAGPEWLLTDFARAEPAPTEPEVTIEFDEGRIAGGSGCNRFMGPLTEGEMPGDLTVGLLAGTMMMCPPEVMEIEGRFRRQLGSVVKYGFLNRQLALTYETDAGDVDAMLFSPRQIGG